MPLYSDPPALLPFRDDKPTLLFCWWATSFCALMILRVIDRFIRTERLFREDKIVAFALMPLVLRMICVHFIPLYGTNNAEFSAVQLSSVQLRQKSIASGLVNASRFFHAATLWVLKHAILDFLKRVTDLTWERSHQATLVVIRWTLVATFGAVFLSIMTECRPFPLSWQVLPDPGGQCRQGLAQLITMATCNMATDALLVIFPIPIILTVIVITVYRLPHIFREHGRQQYRSLLASVELIFATAAANALVLGSFVRDRGLKKPKFHPLFRADSSGHCSNPRCSTLHQRWGSDEDLFRHVGLSVDPELRQRWASPGPDYLSPVSPRSPAFAPSSIRSALQPTDVADSPAAHALGLPSSAGSELHANQTRLSFRDVGGLLDDPDASRQERGRNADPKPHRTSPPTASVPASRNGATARPRRLVLTARHRRVEIEVGAGGCYRAAPSVAPSRAPPQRQSRSGAPAYRRRWSAAVTPAGQSSSERLQSLLTVGVRHVRLSYSPPWPAGNTLFRNRCSRTSHQT